MKITSFLAAALLSVSAFATTTVYHDYAGALHGIALDNACITADSVQTIQATRNCVKLVPVTRGSGDDKYTDWVCEKWETSHVSYPRAFNRTVCTDYVVGNGEQDSYCRATGQQADFLPATIKISVVTSNGDTDNFPGVTRNFTFPACH